MFKPRFYQAFCLALVTSLLGLSVAQANLLISPTRLAFSERDRTASVTLINSGNKTQTYRLEWINQIATAEGGYQLLKDGELNGFPSAAEFLRVSPRQVTLRPNERQTVKVMVRRPRDLADGEYRSHLQFTALPPQEQESDNSQMSIKLNLLLSYNIPVMVRQGDIDANVAIEQVTLLPQLSANNAATIAVRLNHEGKHSTTGRLRAFWSKQGGNREYPVGVLNGLNVYPDTKQRDAKIVWPDFDVSGSGFLKVIYEGEGEFKNRILAEKTIPLRIGG